MIACPHCYFPLAARTVFDPVTCSFLVPCGTCRAVIQVTVTTLQPPSEAWTSNPGHRINLSTPATTNCRDCGDVVPINKLPDHKCPGNEATHAEK